MPDLYLTNNNKNLNLADKEYTPDDVNYLNTRCSYLEKIVQSKYSDIFYLISEISNLKNTNLKYNLVDLIIKHGSNLSKYKEELIDIKDTLDSLVDNQQFVSRENFNTTNNQHIKTEDEKPHNFVCKDTAFENSDSDQDDSAEKLINKSTLSDETSEESESNKKTSLIKNLNIKNLKVLGKKNVVQKSKSELAREKILTNLDKLITYKENTFNDLIEMVDFHIDSNPYKTDLSKFIECLESQIVEFNEYKNNILKNYSLSKSIELASNGKITFSRVFIEKERLIDKNKEEYIRIVTEMHDLYTKFVDSYLKNINYMKSHLDQSKINLMQSNCGKVIYDLKLIKNLYSSIEKSKMKSV